MSFYDLPTILLIAIQVKLWRLIRSFDDLLIPTNDT